MIELQSKRSILTSGLGAKTQSNTRSTEAKFAPGRKRLLNNRCDENCDKERCADDGVDGLTRADAYSCIGERLVDDNAQIGC